MSCIYYIESKQNLTYKKQEHIIPAGIGGRKKLPKSFVSDQANELFSSMEQEFMRDSPISIPRQFFGPGKRGSLTPKKATKSKIHVNFDLKGDNFPRLGYIKIGKPLILSQFHVDENKKLTFSFDLRNSTFDFELKKFIKNLSSFNNNYIFIKEDKLNKNFILGYFENKWFFASSNKKSYNIAMEYIKIIKKDIIKEIKSKNIMHESKIKIKSSYNVDKFDRICGKIVFNFLCYSKGREYVLSNRFNPIRSWILKGGENYYVYPFDPEDKYSLNNYFDLEYPDLSHKIFLFNNKDYIIGLLTFYGNNFTKIIKLCKSSKSDFIFDGFICDWKNEKEIRLIDFIRELNNQ